MPLNRGERAISQGFVRFAAKFWAGVDGSTALDVIASHLGWTLAVLTLGVAGLNGMLAHGTDPVV